MYVSGTCARHSLFPLLHHVPPTISLNPGTLSVQVWASSPNCRTQMPIRSTVSYSSGLGLAHGSRHPCGMWCGLRSCLRRVYLSAKEQDIFGNTVTRWAGHVSAKHHLPKQVRWGCRTMGECVVLAPSTDRNSKHRFSFSIYRYFAGGEGEIGPAFALYEGPLCPYSCTRLMVEMGQICSSCPVDIQKYHIQTKLCSNPGVATY